MSKSYSYFSRLSPKKRRIVRQPEKRQEGPQPLFPIRAAQVQLEPIFALSAVGPSSEF